MMVQIMVTPMAPGEMVLDVNVVEFNNADSGNVFSYSQITAMATGDAPPAEEETPPAEQEETPPVEEEAPPAEETSGARVWTMMASSVMMMMAFMMIFL